MDLFRHILVFVVTSGIIYLGLAAGLILLGKPGPRKGQETAQSFKELFLDYSGIPALKMYPARNGAELGYRFYPAQADLTLILLHGSGWHGRYFMPLAQEIADSGAARVYTPDLRGHGPTPQRRGDIDYINQLVDDLADLVEFIRQEHPGTKVVIGGHSSGGGLALRFAGSGYGRQALGYLLMAPFLKYNAPTTRPGSGGWARAYTPRIAGLSMLNNIGITWFNHLPVIDFNMPQDARDGTETLVYSHRLMTGYAPDNYKQDLKTLDQPLMVLAGSDDQSFHAEKYESTITPHAKAQVELLPGVSHLGLVVVPEVRPLIIDWLRGLPG